MRGFFIAPQKNRYYRCLASVVVFLLIFALVPGPTAVYAQSVLNLPAPGTMITPSLSYAPATMAGMTIHPENPLQFDFIITTGDDNLQGEEFRKESQKLINYFLATLTTPDDEMWVNLSPYEKDRIIADGLGTTEMGRDMLVQDYLLKQLTASLMYPEEELGDEFWKKVYAKSQARFGTTEIPTNTFNKVWIVPEEAIVYVNGTNVFVSESHLKVMLEEDYLALKSNQNSTSHGLEEITKDDIEVISQDAEEVIREVILPEIEREVNEGKNFANLRQIYHSMILATWYKKNLRESVLGKVYMDSNKVEGIDLEDKQVKEKIYEQYIEAFKKGVYNYIREDYDEITQEVIPRKYFSGGLTRAESVVEGESLSPESEIARVRRGETEVKRVKVVLAFLAERSEGVKIDYPLGMTAIAGVLHQEFQDSVKIFQMHNLMAANLDPLIKEIREEKPDVLGLSVYFGSLDELEKIMTFIRSLPEADRPLVVLGSVVATYNVDYLLKQYPETLIGIGFGEAAMNGVVKHVKGEINKEEIPDIAYIVDGKVIYNQRTQGIQLGHALIPGEILQASLLDGGQFYAETSRGCVFCCAICDRATFQGSHSWRGYEIGEIIDNLVEANRHGVRSVNWVDEDLFTFKMNTTDRIEELAQAIIQAKQDGRISKDMIFTTSISTRHIFDKKLPPEDHEKRLQSLRLMYEAGLKYVYVGTESGSPSQLKRYGKAATVEENEKALQVLEEIGIIATPGFIMFDPVVTPEEINENIAFLRRTGMDAKVTYPLKAYIAMKASPLTRLYLNRGLVDLTSYLPGQLSYGRWYFESEQTALAMKIIKDWEESRSLFFRRIKIAFRSSSYAEVSEKERKNIRTVLDRQTKMLLDFLEAAVSLSLDKLRDSKEARELNRTFGILLIKDMVEVLKYIDRKEWTIITDKIQYSIYLGLMREVIRLYFTDQTFSARDLVTKIEELTGEEVALEAIEGKLDLYVREKRLSKMGSSYKAGEQKFKEYRNIPWVDLPMEGLKETKVTVLKNNASGFPAEISIDPEGFNEVTQRNYLGHDIDFGFRLNLDRIENNTLTFAITATQGNQEQVLRETKYVGSASIMVNQQDPSSSKIHVHFGEWFDLPSDVAVATKKIYKNALEQALNTYGQSYRWQGVAMASSPIDQQPNMYLPREIWEWIREELESHDPSVVKKTGSGGYLPRLYQALKTSLEGLDEKVETGATNPYVHIPTLTDKTSPSDNFPPPSRERPLRLAWIAGTGSPSNWGHVNIALTAANDLSLDSIIWRTQGVVKYKKVPKADQVPPQERHELAKELVARFYPLFRYTDLGINDDHEGQEAMFEWANEIADRDQPTELYYIMGSETPQRIAHYTHEYYKWMKKIGLPENFEAHFALMQRGEYGRTLTQQEADKIMADIAKEYDLPPIQAHVIRGPNVDLTIASTYYREAGDAAIIPGFIHDFGVEHNYWGNQKDADGRSMSRVEVFRKEVKDTMIPEVVASIENQHQRNQRTGGHSITRVSIDGASGGGKSTVVDLISEGLRGKGYTVIERQLDLFLNPHEKRKETQKYVVGEEEDPTGRIKPGIWTGENSFFDAAKVRAINRAIDEFDRSTDKTQQKKRFTVKDAYVRTSTGSIMVPNYVWPSENEPPLEKGVILLDEGKYALEYGIEADSGDAAHSRVLAPFYDISFRVLDNPGRNLGLFQMRTRGYRPDEEARMNIFYERALQPSYDAYDARTGPLVDYYLDLSREFFEIIPGTQKRQTADQTTKSWITVHHPVIVVDGRTGVGKTTVARSLANDLGYTWIEFSWLFRAASWYAGTSKESDWTKLVNDVISQNFDIEFADGEARIFVNGQDITSGIYPESADSLQFLERGSKLAAEPKIQEFMQEIFKRKIETLREKQVPLLISGRTVGRDILPDVSMKFFLTADISSVAQRYVASNRFVDLEEAKQAIQTRDERDSQRDTNPVAPYQDVMIVNTSQLSIEEVKKWILTNLTTDDQVMSDENGDVSSSPVQDIGGIDFNPNTLNLSEQGQALNFTIDNSMFQNLQPNSVYGIQPTIINITPVINFTPLLGLERQREEGLELSLIN